MGGKKRVKKKLGKVKRKIIGFYTDKKKRVRPITAPSNSKKLKHPLTESKNRKPVLDKATAESMRTLQNKVDAEFVEECYKRAKRKAVNPLFLMAYARAGGSDLWVKLQGKKLVDEVKEEMKKKYGIYPSKDVIEYMYDEMQ